MSPRNIQSDRSHHRPKWTTLIPIDQQDVLLPTDIRSRRCQWPTFILSPKTIRMCVHHSTAFLVLMIVSTKMEATFRNHSTGQETIIDLNGDFWGGAADLSIQGGPVIAQITRDAFSAREIFSNSQQVCPSDSDRGGVG